MKINVFTKKAKARELEAPEFPYTHREYSVSVKIYRTPHKAPRGESKAPEEVPQAPVGDYDSFTLVYYQDGTRKRVVFKTFEAALAEAKAVARLLGSKDVDVLELRSADRAAYLRATELLKELNTPIEAAVAEYVQAKRLLGDVPLIQAIEYYLRRHPSQMPHKLVKEVVEEMIRAKRGDGLSEGYLRHLGYDLEKFNKHFAGNIGTVTGADIDGWLRGLGVSGRTRNNLRCSVNTLFSYAKAQRYLPKDHDEIEAVGRAKDRDGEIEIFTPTELVEILTHAGPELVPFLAIGAFAGIRHAEIQRLHWEDIRLEDGLIEVRAKKAKTASRRMVPIVPNLKEWLMGYRQEGGLVCSYLNMAFLLHRITKGINEARRAAWAQAKGVTAEDLERAEKEARERLARRKKARGMRRQKGEVPPGAETADIEGWRAFAWKHNALRHSFISYRLAGVKNTAQVALEAGNSPQMIFGHYHELVRPTDAEKWFAVTPVSVEAANAAGEGAKPGNVVELAKVAAA